MTLQENFLTSLFYASESSNTEFVIHCNFRRCWFTVPIASTSYYYFKNLHKCFLFYPFGSTIAFLVAKSHLYTHRKKPQQNKNMNHCIKIRNINILNLFYVYLFIFKERQRAGEGEGQREWERENPKQAPCCQHRAHRGAQTYKLQNHDQSQKQELDS